MGSYESLHLLLDVRLLWHMLSSQCVPLYWTVCWHMSVSTQLCKGTKRKIVPVFHLIVTGPEWSLTLTPCWWLKWQCSGGQLGTNIQIKWLMISCLTWDRLWVLKWCEGPRPTYFLFVYPGAGTTCWSSSVTCIYCSNAKGKCGVKLNGVLAVSMFSLEAKRIKADGERQPGSGNRQLCRINPIAF